MDLKALIQAALKKAGLPEDLHDQIKAENEAEVDGLVEEFAKTYKPSGKGQYIEDFFENVNWKKIEDNFDSARV